jgi:hypothetical protein
VKIVCIPRPMSHDPDVIFHGRMRALEQYRAAQTDADRVRALIWVNHWRLLDEHARAIRPAGQRA